MDGFRRMGNNGRILPIRAYVVVHFSADHVPVFALRELIVGVRHMRL